MSKYFLELPTNIPHPPRRDAMASYESDSDFDDDGNYTETNVLLGYAARESADDTISQLGGYPVSSLVSCLSHDRSAECTRRHGSTTRPRLRPTLQSAKYATTS